MMGLKAIQELADRRERSQFRRLIRRARRIQEQGHNCDTTAKSSTESERPSGRRFAPKQAGDAQ